MKQKNGEKKQKKQNRGDNDQVSPFSGKNQHYATHRNK